MENIDLAYIAGFFDGEGSIGLMPISRKTTNQQPTFQLRAAVINTDKEIVELLKRTFGGDIKSRPVVGNRQAAWIWRVSAVQAVTFLELILPYLRIKKLPAQEAIEFQRHKTRGGRKTNEYLVFEKDAKNKFSILNKRGRDAVIV